jgi:hypothetical protein
MKRTNFFARFVSGIVGENEDHVRSILVFIIGFTVGGIYYAPAPYSSPALKLIATIVAVLFFITEVGSLLLARIRKPKMPVGK